MKRALILVLTAFFIAAMSACENPGPIDGGGSGGECTELVQYKNILAPRVDTSPTGPYKVVFEGDPDFPTHTIIRPVGAKNMPILSWGEGGCAKYGLSYAEMMSEVASYGILVIADGGPKMADMWGGESGAVSPGGVINQTGKGLIQGIDYAFEKNEDPCSPLYHKLDTSKVAVSGQSCGGLLAINAAADPRVTVTFIMSSGLFFPAQRPFALKKIHTPVIYLNGGPTDMAYPQATLDVQYIDENMDIPLYWANLGIGHMADILTDNGGKFGWVLTSWLRYQFFGDPECAAMFEGDDCELCQDTDHTSKLWTLDKYNGAK